MITLCMDTSHTLLAIALLKDEKVLASMQKKCWKKQSEEIFGELTTLMDENGLKPDDIGQVVVSKGPGSYTGVRIAMTVAKVFCAMKNVPVATISTLALFAGNAEHVRVLLDARGGRAYTGVFEYGTCIGEEEALCLEEIKERMQEGEAIVGDGHLIERDDVEPDLAKNFLDLRDHWEFAKNVHLVKPEYLKPSESYLVRK